MSLVEWCIEQAIERKFQSISFPPVRRIQKERRKNELNVLDWNRSTWS